MIRVLVVDDSPSFRRLFTQILSAAPDIEVVGEAGDPFAARDLIVELEPDVLTLDVEMPRMDGITFLRRLMHYYPKPVVVCSSLTVEGGEVALSAMEAGAIEVICKPNPSYSSEQMGRDLVAAVRTAAASRGRPALGQRSQRGTAASVSPQRAAPALGSSVSNSNVRVLAIGASTGGVVAIEALLRGLPQDMPPILITQHMPPYMTQPFAARLAKIVPARVMEAEDGALLRWGEAFVAPGGKHLALVAIGAELRLRVREGPRVNGHRPSVDVLFHSVAEATGARAVGVLLTGMGRDGARGLLEMRNAGATTIAQDEASSVVFGMPKAAIDLDAVDVVAALDAIPDALLSACRDGRSSRRPVTRHTQRSPSR